MDERQVALVTGANRGIGLEICRQLAERGLQVILTARDEEHGRGACEGLRRKGLAVVFSQLDVTEPQSIQQVRSYVEDRFRRLDVLVNNAGVCLEQSSQALEMDMQTVRRTLETNLLGPWMVCQAFIPLLRNSGSGRIVNVSSGKGSFARLRAGQPAYRVSKAALNALTVILADELRDTHILVNAITPGWVRTRLGGIKAERSVAEGADTAVWLAIAPDGQSGRFFKDRREFPW